MGSRAWKRLEKSRPFTQAKLFVRRTLGRELWLRPETAVPTTALGDWCVNTAALNADSVVYSLGIGDDIAFDRGLIEAVGCEVHAFDPTPFARRWIEAQTLPAGFHFHPWAVAGCEGSMTLYPRVKKDGTLCDVMFTQVCEARSQACGIDVPVVTLKGAMRRLGHERIDVLKADIEGAEYEVLATLPSPPPAQLMVEFHHRFVGIGLEKTAAAIAGLREARYRVMAVSPSGREVSFLRGAGT